jgi:hypothetical protein
MLRATYSSPGLLLIKRIKSGVTFPKTPLQLIKPNLPQTAFNRRPDTISSCHRASQSASQAQAR